MIEYQEGGSIPLLLSEIYKVEQILYQYASKIKKVNDPIYQDLLVNYSQ